MEDKEKEIKNSINSEILNKTLNSINSSSTNLEHKTPPLIINPELQTMKPNIRNQKLKYIKKKKI